MIEQFYEIENRTAHDVDVWNNYPQDGGKVVHTYPACAPEDEVRSVRASRTERLGFLSNGVPVILDGLSAPYPALPPERPGKYYIVSSIIAALCPDRYDLLRPGKAVLCGGMRSGCLGLVLEKRREV